MTAPEKYSVTLRELADLAIGTPEVGAVNFTALHTLIVAILNNMNLQHVAVDYHAPLAQASHTALPAAGGLQGAEPRKHHPSGHAGRRGTAFLENQIKDLDGQLKSMENQIHDIVAHMQNYGIPVPTTARVDAHRSWEQQRPEAQAEDQPQPATGAQDELLAPTAAKSPSITLKPAMPETSGEGKDEKNLQDLLQRAQDFLRVSPQKILQRLEELEKMIHQRDAFLDAVGRKLSVTPAGEDVTMVTWEDLEQAITDGWRLSQAAIAPLETEDTAAEPSRSRQRVPAPEAAPPSGAIRHLGIDQQLPYGTEGLALEDEPRRGRESITPAPEEGAKGQAPAASQWTKALDQRRPRKSGTGEQDKVPGTDFSAPSRPPVDHMEQYGAGPYGAFPEDYVTMPLPTEGAYPGQSTFPQQGVLPTGMAPLGTMPHLGMDEQGLTPEAMSQLRVVPPLVPSRHQLLFQLPSPDWPPAAPEPLDEQGFAYGQGREGRDQLGVVAPFTEQPALVSPSLMQFRELQQGLAQPGLGIAVPTATEAGVGQPAWIQPDMGQVGMTQPGMRQPFMAQPGVELVDMAQPGMGQVGVAQPGMGQVGVTQLGMGQVGVAQPGMGQVGVAQPGMGQVGVAQPGMGQVGVAQPGMGQVGVAQLGMGQVGVTQPGLGQVGVAQPGMGQVGVAQLGMGQAGMAQLDLAQLGMVQAGIGQPGVGQVGVAQLGMGQVGVSQLGMGQVGVVQPGMGQVGVSQLGMGQVGVSQLGMGQVGVVQPGMGQVGVVQPSVGQVGMAQPGVGQLDMPGVGRVGMPGVVAYPGVEQVVAQPGMVHPSTGQPSVGQPDIVQPGMGQPGLGQPGMVQPGLGQPGMVQPGMGQPGMGLPGIGQPGVGQPDIVQPGVGQPGMVQPGMGQPGMGQPGMVQPGVGQPGMVQPGMVQSGMGQPDIVQPGVGQPGMVQPGLGQPGMGLAGVGQPGVGQHDIIQPSMGQPSMVQPGMGQPSVGQPGIVQPGIGQPGMGQPGVGQFGIVEPGLGQPGMVQPGVGQPGVGQPGIGQPGVGQPGMVQPGIGQPGMVQPSMGQPGMAEPGVGQPSRGQSGVEQPGMVQPGGGQPSMGQPGLGQPGMVQPGTVPPGVRQPGMVPPGTAPPGVVQPGMVPPGTAPPGVVQPGMVPPGTAPPGVVQPGMVPPGTAPPGVVQPGMVPPGTAPPGVVQPGMVPPGTAPPGVVQPGMVPPGTAPPGVVQPGMVPPGTAPPGVVQPGTVPPGTAPPGVVQPGMVPPGTAPPGVVQPGMVPPGTAPPGVVQPGMVPPGTAPPGVVQPGTVPPGTAPPGVVQPGMVPPGTAPPGVVQPGMVPPGTAPPGVVQPGMVPPGVVQPGMGPPGTAPPGVVQPGMGPPGTAPPGVVQPGMVSPGTAPPGVVQPGMVPPGTAPPGVVQPGMVSPGTAPPRVVQPGMGTPGTAPPGVVQPGMVPPGTAPPGVVQPGMVPPGTAPPGVVQPGMGTPGTAPPGVVQPGMVPPGTAPPGVVQPGMVPPGTAPPGVVQPGMVPPGTAPPGVVQPGMVPPGMAPPRVVQPGMVPSGTAPPGVVQPGMVPPGTGQPAVVLPDAGQPGGVQAGIGQPALSQPGPYPPGSGPPGAAQPDLGQAGAFPLTVAPPGADQTGLAQPELHEQDSVPPGMDLSDLLGPGMVQPGPDAYSVQPSVTVRGVAPLGASPYSPVQPKTPPYGPVQPETPPYGPVQPGTHPRGPVQPGASPRGPVQPGTPPYGPVQPGASPRGPVQPGTPPYGPVQPGAYPRGPVQPGTPPYGPVQPGAPPYGPVQPGAYPHGPVQPGAPPYGPVQPGAPPYGPVQPGAYPRGPVQPGAPPYGPVQPGAPPYGPVQPGAYPRGPIQPGTPPYGPVQPGAYPYGPVQPGAYPRGPVHPGAHPPGMLQPEVDRQGRKTDREVGGVPEMVDVQGIVPPRLPEYKSERKPQDQTVTHSPMSGVGQEDLTPSETRVPPRAPSAAPEAPRTAGVARPSLVLLAPTRSGFVSLSKSSDTVRHASQVSADGRQSERHESLHKLEPNFPIAVEMLRTMGEMVGLYTELKEKMKEFDWKTGESELDKLQHVLERMVQKSIPPDLHEQLKSLRSLSKEIRHEKAKLERLLGDQADVDFSKEPEAGKLGLQLGLIRLTVSDIEKELAELRKSQELGKEAMEHSVAEASLYLQDQLDKLRAIIENMLASSSTLLSMSMVPRKMKPTDKPTTALAPRELSATATCPACSLDLGHQVSMLVQRYEQLQDMVSSLAASRPSKKAKLQSQDEELLGHVQSAILQVQGDCEKLNVTTSNLIEDHRQKQKDIAVLYQGLEKLEKEKANREHLEMEIDVKADKSALAATVTRVQFDAATEQLNKMMQELVARVSGQEQDWQKMVDKILVEMDTKLNRLELDPLRQQLEDRWRAIRRQLQERPPLYQADDASAMRRQLLAHFHCLSCDRPLETAVTGQLIPVTPLGPSMPGHRSIRPYTVLELEQIRQQSRSTSCSTRLARGDVPQREHSVGRLRTMHTRMLMDIEKVRIHFGGSAKASSQMIRELLQARCLQSPCYRRGADATNYTYSAIPRHCGGSHTLTYPFRRARPQHPHATEEVQIAMKHNEVDILGLDGHIYKGRMDTRRFPSLPTKEADAGPGGAGGRPKPGHSRPQQLQTVGELSQLLRPLSAQMMLKANTATGRQRKDRPISSEGYLSEPFTPTTFPRQLVPTPPPLPPLGAYVHPREGHEEPTRGPRSTAGDKASSSDT